MCHFWFDTSRRRQDYQVDHKPTHKPIWVDWLMSDEWCCDRDAFLSVYSFIFGFSRLVFQPLSGGYVRGKDFCPVVEKS